MCNNKQTSTKSSCFFFNDTATTEIYTLSLHDALPISWLHYGRAGRAVGTRTDSYFTVSLVGLDLNSGKSLYSAVAYGQARPLATDYEDARPFYPRISPGHGNGAFIYPQRPTFASVAGPPLPLGRAVKCLIFE